MSKKHKKSKVNQGNLSIWDDANWDDDESLSLAEEAEKLGQQRDSPDPDDIYFEDTDEMIDEAEAFTKDQPSPILVLRNKRIQSIHELCDTIARNHCYLSIDGEQLVRYIPELGCYQEDKPPEVMLRKFAGSNDYFLRPKDTDDMIKILKHDPYIQANRDDFNCDPYLINLQSGVLDWAVGEVEEHSRGERFTYCIDAQYLDEDAPLVCPTFDNFCQTSLEGDPMKRQLLLEIIGYCCSDCNSGKCAFFLKGEPDSGKSVMLEFMTRLIGQRQVSNVPLHKLSERFMRAELYGKKLNCAGEITGKALREISTFKSITGADRIEAERKGKDPFFFTPKCKLLFAGNALPGTTESDSTKAFTNRLVVLLFNRSIPKERQDKQMLDKLTKEKNTIFTLAVQALRELSSRNYQFTRPKDSAEFLASFSERGSSFQAFWNDCCEQAEKGSVSNTELYGAYLRYCERNGLEAYSRNKLYEFLSGIPGVAYRKIRQGSKTLQGHTGIKLRESYDRNFGTGC